MTTTATKTMLTLYSRDGAALTLRVPPGYEHVWNMTHYNMTPLQAARVRAFHAAHGEPELSGVRLHVTPATGTCPCCTGKGHKVVRA